MRKVLLLGASGSIGTQTLDILERDKERFELLGFSVGKRVEKIPFLLTKFPSVSFLCVQREEDYQSLKKRYPSLHLYHGDDGLSQIVKDCPADMVVNALVGFSGMVPSVRALENGRILCLANKESLVVGGALIQDLLKQKKGKLYPIDSEHVAIAKLLSRIPKEDISEILITASGGSFRDKKRDELKNVTPEMALNHPTWAMGAKITIDSATMMNKGFELLEAKWLFNWPLEKTKVLMHRESHVHSCVKLKDGTYVGDVSAPDMHGPIAYALYEGEVDFELVRAKTLPEFGPYHFGPFEPKRYPAVELALNSFKKGGTAPCILNAANEEAVFAFLRGEIPFLSIEKTVQKALESLPIQKNPSLMDLVSCDHLTRGWVKEHIAGGKL